LRLHGSLKGGFSFSILRIAFLYCAKAFYFFGVSENAVKADLGTRSRDTDTFPDFSLIQNPKIATLANLFAATSN